MTAESKTGVMRLLVLGGTGGTGREIVRQALAEGHAVTALVRSTANAPDLHGATLVEGDARDGTALARALDGCDAVASSLGTGISPFREVTLLSDGTRALVAAMGELGVRRLVCITGIGAGDSRGHGGFFYDRLLLPFVLGTVYADKDRQERIIRDSDLDWVIVRPSLLQDAPGRGTYRVLTDLAGFHGGRIARADVATFVVRQLSDPTCLHRTPLVTW